MVSLCWIQRGTEGGDERRREEWGKERKIGERQRGHTAIIASCTLAHVVLSLVLPMGG